MTTVEPETAAYTALDAQSLGASSQAISQRSAAQEEEEKQEAINKAPFCTRLFTRYNKSFLFALAMQYSNTGMRQMLVMAMQNLYDIKY
jgi:hypothetical protein